MIKGIKGDLKVENIDNLYRIDKERLLGNYRITKKILGRTEKNEIKIVAQWLADNQSVGPSQECNIEIINYYNKYLKEDKSILDFALEWVRALKIRVGYKGYLIKTRFPKDDLNLTIDYFISIFFLKYNEILKDLFKNDIRECEISALLEILFTSNIKPDFSLTNLLEKHKNNPQCPTIYKESKRIDTSILTLRSGLVNVIERDYKSIM